MYIKELKTLIYSEDSKEYYILKLDLKSFYDSINLQKLHLELTQILIKVIKVVLLKKKINKPILKLLII